VIVLRYNKSGVPILSKENIETEAFNVLKSYNMALIDTPSEVPIELIIENHFGLQMDFKILSEDEEGILGLTTFTSGALKVFDQNKGCIRIVDVTAGTIIIDDRLASDSSRYGRYRFTCAHEISHWHLHRHKYIKNKNQISLFIDNEEAKAVKCLGRNIEAKISYGKQVKTDEEWLEWQADYMAAALLMPEKAYKNAFKDLAKTAGLEENYILCISKNESIVKNIVEVLSNAFKVSKQAARIRLFNLGLLKIVNNSQGSLVNI
jgi:hypothetical protein